MKIRCLITACIFLNFLILVQSCAGIIHGPSGYTKEEVHGINQDCNICHRLHKTKEILLLKKPISELCLECHPGRKGPSEHVVDVVPSMKVGNLPLTEGKMTCVTCHDSHKNIYRNMLRIGPESLCQSCHRY